jgi:hypothetical protein
MQEEEAILYRDEDRGISLAVFTSSVFVIERGG